MTSEQSYNLLARLSKQLAFEVTDQQLQQLHQYLQLLVKWNRTYNLTSVRDELEMVTLHLLDSMVVAPYINAPRMLDVGSGGGMPAIVLAILHPDQHWTLCDTAGKKARFLNQVKIELKLANVEVIHGRVEQAVGQFDGISSRAFATIKNMYDWSNHLLAANGRYYALKGKDPIDEISEVDKHLRVVENRSLEVPNLQAERHLIILEPLGA